MQCLPAACLARAMPIYGQCLFFILAGKLLVFGRGAQARIIVISLHQHMIVYSTYSTRCLVRAVVFLVWQQREVTANSSVD